MNKPKTDKLLKGLVGSSVALFGLTGCAPGLQDELMSVPAEPEANVQPDTGPPSPEEADCDTWQWDEEAEGYQCVEPGNENHGHYYYGGMWFPTIAAFMAGRATAGGARGGGGGQVRQPATGTQPDQNVTQPRQDQNQTRTPNRATNPRSGMGGGGSFGG
ncbi:hypothetical protein [Halalkalibacter alkaliphilus]|uniref:Lipoprotein n=1 Tax=Halalkalibacter alkaliphilus TaxID=2917993 RepID=A0A9X2CTJ3_9BACI|nr:hypothetical protein [Halalkalibacter alkaliphilus]MCL7747993.1 hypothetical protein [Halalkalibacter alkaliphilus]